MRAELAGRLAEVPGLSSLGPDDLRALVEACHELHVRTGEVVVEEGDDSGDLLLVLRGHLSRRQGRDFAVLGPGAFVAPQAPLLDQPHAERVQALQRSQLAVLPADSWALLAASHAPIGLAVQRAILDQLLRDLVTLQERVP